LVQGDAAINGVLNPRDQVPELLCCLQVISATTIQCRLHHLRGFVGRVHVQGLARPAFGFIQPIFTFQ